MARVCATGRSIIETKTNDWWFMFHVHLQTMGSKYSMTYHSLRSTLFPVPTLNLFVAITNGWFGGNNVILVVV